MRETENRYSGLFKCLLLGVLGLLILFISSLFQNIEIPKEQQDLSHFLNYNFTTPVVIIFFIVGVAIGYFLNVNPWKAGLCLFLAFPLTAFIEMLLNIGADHNLIPFELVMYFLYALPSIIAIYIGRFIAEQVAKRNGKANNSDSNSNS